MNKRVFISYASRDRHFVEGEIVSALSTAGYTPVYDQSDIRAGDNLSDSIRAMLNNTGWFIVVLSTRSVESTWVQSEVQWAFENRTGRIVPVLLEDCDVARLRFDLTTLLYADYTKSAEKARQSILRKLSETGNNPLAATLDVFVLRKGAGADPSLHVSDPDTLPLLPGDKIRLEVSLSQPCYPYVIWIPSQGEAIPLYPWEKGQWNLRPAPEAAVQRLLLPADSPTKGWPLNGPSGVETVLLLVRSEPLSETLDVEGLLDSLPIVSGLEPLTAPAEYLSTWDSKLSTSRTIDVSRVDDMAPVPITLHTELRDRLQRYFPLIRCVSMALGE